MGGYVIYIFLLTILHSVLFFDKSLGINVITFITPLLIFLVMILKDNKKIKNKKGLFLIIPITLISLSYLIYDNEFIEWFNPIVIVLLTLSMYIISIRPTNNIIRFIKDGIHLLFEPLGCIGKFYNIVCLKIGEFLKLSETGKKKLKSLLIVIPIVIVILLLLCSADLIFKTYFDDLFKLLEKIKIDTIIGRIIIGLIVFTCIGATTNYLLFNFKHDKNKKDKKLNIDSYTIKLLLTILNVIYIVFDFIQIKSLMLHQVAKSINYAEYARSGFFQLMFISLINITIILISKHEKEETKYTKAMSIIMILLTLVIIISSSLRMYLYESAYGYTLLRLLVYATLLTETVLLIPTVIYITNSKVNIFKYYLIIITTAYTILCLTPLDYIIANNNINKYYKDKKIDLLYLENYHSDNIPLLIEFMQQTNNKWHKEELDTYLRVNDFYKTKSVVEFNISKHKAENKIFEYKHK